MCNGSVCILGQTFGMHAEKCLAKEMYPEEWEAASEEPEQNGTYGFRIAGGMIPKLLKKLGRDPELDPELKVLRRVCDGHDNRCFWAEEVAERLAQDGY